MLYDKPIKCTCNSFPEMGRKNISDTSNPDYYYYYYSCDKCDISTFGTREEESARELWNAMIVLRKSKMEKK